MKPCIAWKGWCADMNTKRFKVMAIIGIVMLALYGIMTTYSPVTDGALEAGCRAALSRRGDAAMGMIARCAEPAFATAMTATDASSAARRISSSNQRETILHMASMFALGMGSILTLIGLLGLFDIIKPRGKTSV